MNFNTDESSNKFCHFLSSHLTSDNKYINIFISLGNFTKWTTAKCLWKKYSSLILKLQTVRISVTDCTIYGDAIWWQSIQERINSRSMVLSSEKCIRCKSFLIHLYSNRWLFSQCYNIILIFDFFSGQFWIFCW